MTNKEEKNRVQLKEEVARLTKIIQSDRDLKNIYLDKIDRYVERCNYLEDSNRVAKEIYSLVVEMNTSLKVELHCYENGIKPTCSDFANAMHISQGKKPRPDYVLQKNWFLPLMN